MTGDAERTIVIGAGMGGLSAAMRLAHAGCDVTVVEAQAAPGGKMRTLDSSAGPVDAGPTVLTMRHVFEELFDDVGQSLSDHVELEAEELLARHWWPDGSSLDLFHDAEASEDAVRAFAGPKSASEFKSFSRKARALFEAFDAPMMRAEEPRLSALTAHVLSNPSLVPAMAPLSTLAGVLRRQFSDPRLRQLFGRYATYVGGSPYQSPAVLALIWHAEASGVWRVVGGMHRLARAMEDVAKSLGATFRYNSSVTRIEVQGGRASAVQLSTGERMAADRIVFNGDPRALAQGLLGDGPRGAVAQDGTEPRSLSARVWSFAATAIGAPLVYHNVFFGTDPRSEFEPIARGKMPDDPTLYICAQDRGGGHAPDGPERFEIIMNAAPYLGGAEEDIASCRIRTFPQLARWGLRFSPEPPDSALTTPRVFDRLFPASQGSLYGRSPHGMMAAFQRPTARTPLPGLYLAGGGAHPGAGVPMATLSGRHAAAAILMDRTSTSPSLRTAMPGGTLTGSATAAPTPSR